METPTDRHPHPDVFHRAGVLFGALMALAVLLFALSETVRGEVGAYGLLRALGLAAGAGLALYGGVRVMGLRR